MRWPKVPHRRQQARAESCSPFCSAMVDASMSMVYRIPSYRMLLLLSSVILLPMYGAAAISAPPVGYDLSVCVKSKRRAAQGRRHARAWQPRAAAGPHAAGDEAPHGRAGKPAAKPQAPNAQAMAKPCAQSPQDAAPSSQ